VIKVQREIDAAHTDEDEELMQMINNPRLMVFTSARKAGSGMRQPAPVRGQQQQQHCRQQHWCQYQH
jgi:hypothetical protein